MFFITPHTVHHSFENSQYSSQYNRHNVYISYPIFSTTKRKHKDHHKFQKLQIIWRNNAMLYYEEELYRMLGHLKWGHICEFEKKGSTSRWREKWSSGLSKEKPLYALLSNSYLLIMNTLLEIIFLYVYNVFFFALLNFFSKKCS